MNLTGRSLRTVQDFTREEIWHIFELAKKLKDDLTRGKSFETMPGRAPLAEKHLAMIFQKKSLRTRMSFELAMEQLGGCAHVYDFQNLQLGSGESMRATARVTGGWFDAIMARVGPHADIDTLAEHAGVPVINGLSDEFHPCQALTDLFTLWEKGFDLGRTSIAFIGDGGDNVSNSLMLACARLGVDYRIGCPPEYRPQQKILDISHQDRLRTGTKIWVVHDPMQAIDGADVIYTDVWASMGQENEARKRTRVLQPYQVNRDLLSYAKKDAVVMHCMPVHEGKELTAEIMYGPNSIIFDQAHNRLHVQKAILALLMSNHFQDGI